MPRFSLLLLDHGEVLFESALCNLRFDEEDDTVDGRVFLCSKSLFFEPKMESKPIIRFVYKAMGCEPRFSDSPNSIVFRIKKTVEIKPSQPYVLRIHANSISITCELKHTKASKFCALINDLFTSKRIHEDLVVPRLMEPFDRSRMVDFREQVVLPKRQDEVIVMEKIEPLVTVYGCMLLTDVRIYFQHCRLNNLSGQARHCLHWNLANVELMNKRRYLMQEVGLELKTADNAPVLFAFATLAQRDEFYSKVVELAPQLKTTMPTLEEYTRMWQLGQIDNFTYLEKLNAFADRSTLDFTQYPVYPWVVADYTSQELDLDNVETFRDLSKPIGALNPQRLEQFQQRYNDMLLFSSNGEEDSSIPPFLYGTHYSTPGFVLFYLIRQRADEALRLQNGKFDSPDRMFHSMEQTWQNVLHSSTDVKELIPEFYHGAGQFLLNSNRLEFGKRLGDGQRVNDVELPPWANHSPTEFVRKMRLALESDIVSASLHLWIDLVFGVEQRSIAKNNVFYHLTYPKQEGRGEMDEVMKRSNEAQIMEFGQTPKQLFSQKHPARAHHFEDVVVATAAGSLITVEDENNARNAEAEATTTHAAVNGVQVVNQWPETLRERLSQVQLLRAPASGEVLDACIAHDFRVLACGDGSLQFLTSHGQVTRRVRLSKLALSSVIVASHTDLLIGSWDNSLCRYSVSTGRVLFRIDNAHDDAVSQISTLNEGLFASSSWDSSVKVWQQERAVHSFYSHACPVLSVNMRDNNLLVSSNNEGGIHVHDMRVHSYDAMWQTQFCNAPVETCAWVNTSQIVCSSRENGLALFDIRIQRSNSPPTPVTQVRSAKWQPTCFATDGAQIAVGDFSGRVTLCAFDKLEHVPFESNVIVRQNGPVAVVRVHTESGVLLTCSTNGQVGLSEF